MHTAGKPNCKSKVLLSLHIALCQQEMEDKVISPEKSEEAKLKARYPNLGGKPGGSEFLRKRLQKGVSFLT